MSSDLASEVVGNGHEYYPLDYPNKEFRVLNFVGDRNTIQDGSSILEFNFQALSLKDEALHIYHAISYTWDINPGTATIMLQGKDVVVPGSAERALRGVVPHMIPDLPDSSICLLWIDAVCIDQANLDEKSKQVAMMRDIYASARGVFVWLGEDDVMAKTPFETVEILAEDCATNGPGDAQLYVPASAWKEKFTYWSEPPPSGCDWEAFGRLLQARWFTRLWIIQEVVVADYVKILRGRHSIAWETFARAVRWTWHRSFTRHIKDAIQSENETSVDMNILFAREVCRLRDTPSSEVALSQLLLCNCYIEASNPWDRVFGLLGLLSDQKSLGLVPDYGQPLRDVYAHATYAGMAEQGNFYLLSLAIGNRSSLAVDEDWPSWVPRYHQLKGHREIALFSRANGCLASEGASMSCSYSSEGNVLSVKGVLVGRVVCVLDMSSLGDMSDHGADDDSDSENDEEEEKAVYQHLAHAWFSGSSLASANTSVSLSSIATSLQRQKDSTLRLWRKKLQIKDFASLFLNVAKQCPVIYDTDTERLFSLAGADEGDSWSIVCSLQDFVRTLGLSSIVMLEDGVFAFCVGRVEVGDDICLLFGGDLLFVLRPGEGERHSLRGYAVVSGVMEGELVQKVQEQLRFKAEPHTFQIF